MSAKTTTDRLIASLASEARAPDAIPRLPLRSALLLTSFVSLGVGAVIVSLIYGLRPDLSAKLMDISIILKCLAAAALAVGGYFVVLRAGMPENRGLALPALLPGVALLLIGALHDHSGLTVIGRIPTSPLLCVSAIVLVSVLPLGLILMTLRQGAPTRLTTAGAAAGLLAGAIGATAYTIACKVDSGVFVAVWYAVAIAVMAGIGAAVGRRALAW